MSLPDYAFRKAGAQNKTSLLFVTKYAGAEKQALDSAYREFLDEEGIETQPTIDQDKRALRLALSTNPYKVFLAEVEEIGYTPSGGFSRKNQLYKDSDNARLDYHDPSTVLGQYTLYLSGPGSYAPSSSPSCHALSILDILDGHPSYRLDPKFHLFQLESIHTPPPHMKEYRLGDLLVKRLEEVVPADFPDHEFLTLTLSQEGNLLPREAGKGINPPSWHGAYFTSGSRWYRAYADDLIISQIDVWKGCVAVIPPEFDQAIVTQEFPLYSVDRSRLDPKYLTLLLRSRYFQRAIRAITTGHSNRRRTQPDDFENLSVFLPDIDTQRALSKIVDDERRRIGDVESHLASILSQVEAVVLGERDPLELLASVASYS
ncbi:MAG: hypothetical protein Q7O66_09125 [Dehalococcoidia bacterium]|nr:hypothetical protein [Dehalococcoidia bacterium]